LSAVDTSLGILLQLPIRLFVTKDLFQQRQIQALFCLFRELISGNLEASTTVFKGLVRTLFESI
jgi:hypothetical protein